MAVRYGGDGVPNFWHLDTGGNERVAYPTYTCVCADMLPTQYLFNHPFVPDMSASFRQKASATAQMMRAARFNQLSRQPVGKRDIRQYDPYDISGHTVQVIHRGTFHPRRASVVLYSAHSDLEASIMSPRSINPLFGQRLRKMGVRTAPMEQAVDLAGAYYQRYCL